MTCSIQEDRLSSAEAAVDIQLDVVIACPDWRALGDDLEACAQSIITRVIKRCAPDLPAIPEVSLVLSDNETVLRLNAEYRGRNKPTNVLSFPGWDGTSPPDGAPVMLGDIVMAFAVVEAEAAAQKKSLMAHFAHLLVHGTLHLLGYDHEEEAAATKMEDMETQLLEAMGFGDPYAMNWLET